MKSSSPIKINFLSSKKGLSEVVTTVLIILLVLGAIAIIWAFVGPVIKRSASGISTTSFTVNMQILPNSVVVDPVTKMVTLKIKRETGAGTVSGVKIVLTDSNGNTKAIENKTSFAELESKTLIISYANSTLGSIVEVSVAPIFLNEGNAEVSGQITDTEVLGSVNGQSATCGNGVINSAEQCDGSNLNGQTCVTQGFASGTLACASNCNFNTAACVSPPSTFALTVTINGLGNIYDILPGTTIDCGNGGTKCSATYGAGLPVTLVRVPGANNSFSSWGGVCNGTGNTCSMIMDSNFAVIANFVVSQCSDNLDNDGDGYKDYPQDHGCTAGNDNTEQAASECYDSDNGQVFNVGGNVTVYLAGIPSIVKDVCLVKAVNETYCSSPTSNRVSYQSISCGTTISCVNSPSGSYCDIPFS